MRKSCDNCKYKDTHDKCGTCIEEYDAPLENWEPIPITTEQLIVELNKRNLKLEHIMEYIKFEDECIEKGFTFDSLLEAREKQIPKKPVIKVEEWNNGRRYTRTKRYCCPICGHYPYNIVHEEHLQGDLFDGLKDYTTGKKHRYCAGCGQALDWGE